MRSPLLHLFVLVSLANPALAAKKIPIGRLLDRMVHRSTLAEPGGRPFYLRATITDRNDTRSQFNGTVEEYWVSPTKYRRVVKLRDFSQTRMVNGDKIYEDNKGDYFPYDDEMLADEIVDPLPKPAIDLMNRLDIQATEPGDSEGQCMAEKYFDDDEGEETRVLLAYNCKTGLLIYLWSPTCCYGVMADYKKFHDKQVAFSTKEDPVNIHIDTLRDLDSPDEALFAITDTTPPAQRLTTTHIGEKAVRQLITEQKEIRWPAVSNKPAVKSINVHLVIGRDGKVKQAWSYEPVEEPVKNAALDAIRQWTFKPQTVNGVPAQISTKLVIPIAPQVQGAAASQPDAKPVFERARAAGGIRLEGAPPFHMKASFHTEDGKLKGTYEETWVAPKRWRREVKLNAATVTEIRTEEAFYRVFPGQFAPRIPDDILEVMSFPLPGDSGGDVYEVDWKVVNAKLGGVPVLRLSRGYVNPQEKPDPTTLQFFIEEKTGFVRGRYHYSNFTVFNDLQPFAGKSVARKLTSFGGDFRRMELTIESLEPATTVPDDNFKLAGVKPVFTSEDEGDQRFTQPTPTYTVKPALAGWHGKAECDLFFDEHGHVRQVDVQGVTDESIIAAIRVALMNWEYTPTIYNGRPVAGLSHVVVR